MKRYQVFNHAVLLICLLFLVAEIAQAQVTITGMVTDTSGASLSSANVMLLNPSDSSLVKGAVTNEAGRYRLENISRGSYILSVSMVGFKKHFTPEFEADQSIVELDTVILRESVEQMDEVAVKARKPLFEQQVDRLVVNVQRSIVSSGSSVLEVLEKSPGIQINRQSNNISMNGKSGVRVMVDDKIVRLPTDAVIQMLNGMSSANVEEIELISTPPAKYEAEGDAGIINIKMKELTDAGSRGSVGGSLGYNKAETLGGNLNYSRRGKKFSYFINYSINHNRNEQIWRNERYLRQDGFVEEVITHNQRNPIINVQNARLGMEYDITTSTTVGILLKGYRRKWETEDFTDISNRLAPDSTLNTEMTVHETNDWRNALFNTSLDHSFSENRTLSFDFDYLYYKNDNPSKYQNKFLSGDRALMDTEGIEVEKETPINFWVSKIDYRDQFNDNFTLETGFKGTLSKFFNDVKVFEKADDAWNINDRYTSEADLTEKIGAAYISGNWNPSETIKVKGGLRYEYTDSYMSTPNEQGLIDREYGHLFPTLFINKDLSKETNIGISYNRRITRPTFNDMAPFVFFLSPNTYLSGTPSLKPAVTDGLKLDFQYDSWLVSLHYTYTKDEIGTFQPEINSDTNEQTYRARNLDYLRSWALTTNIPLKPASWWQIQTNVTGRYQISKTDHFDNDFTKNNTGLTANITNTFELPSEFSIEVSGHYQSKTISGLLEYRPRGAVNAGIQKKISDGRGTLRLSMNDIFRTNIFRMDTYIPQFNLDTFMKYDRHMREINLSFTWNFGDNNLDAVDVETGSSEEEGRVNTN